ncbi:hypothetical protein NMY22_g6230 [Coprinellus aureogranulatus]|nr:hypothetical protein NMY22_g6230 [Coprinellus aureogranulatus]
MSLKFNTQDRPRKRDRFFGFIRKPFSRSSSNRAQSDTSGAGANIEHPAVASQSGIQVEHHGHSFNTTNTGSGPVNNLGHVENAHFHLSDGGSNALLWNSLPKQRDHTSAQHNEYLEGSREGDVREIMRWIDSAPPDELVLWIQGAAGVGKSTLARHLTHVLRKDNRLAASVFLSGVPSGARSPESVVKVIARDMGTIHPKIIPFILSAISSCHSAPFKDHLKKYLCDPVCSLRLPSSAIFLLDATDEWEYFDAFVKELESISALSVTLKFIFLGRSDPRTRGYRGSWIRSYRLEPVSSITMKRYIVKEFTSVKWDLGRAPSENQITKLVELADGLFIWAKVVCSLMKKKLSLSSASETLEAIIYSRQSVAAEEGLSRLYHQAIVWLFPTPHDQDLLRKYLGAALVLQEPLPVQAFSSLTGLPIRIVESIRAELTALQIRQPVGDALPQIHPVNMLVHLSFLEYLESLSTPPDITFHISAFEAHAQLAESCLVELRKFLPNAHTLKLADLSARQKYAIKHMPLHVHRGTPSVEPEFDVDWKRTPHSSLLQGMPIPSLEQWGRLLVEVVQLSRSTKDAKFSRESRNALMMAVRLKPGNPYSWSKLGRMYGKLAMSTRSRDACNRAVQAYRSSLRLDELSDSDKGHMLGRLGTALLYRQDYFGGSQDLEEAIAVLRSALDACPQGQHDYEACLNNLSAALRKTGSTSNLQESICIERQLLELRPPGHPERNLTLDNLASSLSQTGHPQRGITLNNLALALSDTGSPDDLQESIRLNQEALELRPSGHQERHQSLHFLAYALEKTGSPDDLKESIQLFREALELRPPGHPGRDKVLNNLASVLYKTGSPDGLEESIQYHREALELRPPGHPRHASVLDHLADALEKRGSTTDLEEARRLREEAQAI